jgi:hypothetical protein
MLHIHSGDCSATAASGIFEGKHLVWSDNLFEGPLPRGDWNDAVWLDARAGALADYLGGRDRAAFLLGKRYEIIQEAVIRSTEITLWFDSCLYDMMLVCQFLWFTRNMLGGKQVYLICEEIRSDGRRFAGYGELDEKELKTMFGRSKPVTAAMLEDGLDSWTAFTSSDPADWQAMMQKNHPLTPFLRPAAERLLEQLPDSKGLNRLEEEILTALSSGHTGLKDLFQTVLTLEERPFFGDTVVWQKLNRMAAVPIPLVELHGPGKRIPVNVFPLPNEPEFKAEDWEAVITAEGKRILEGAGSASAAGNQERWIANVKLTSGCGLLHERKRRK